MSLKSKKFISLFLAFSLMAISCTTMTTQRQKRFESSKERKQGAKLIIQRIGNQVRQEKKTRLEGTPWETSVITDIRGELIAVKQNSLLLLDAEGKDVSIDIADIKVIRIVKKSKALQGAGLGSLIGGGGMYLYSQIVGDSESEIVLVFTLGAAVIGASVGGLIGAISGKDKTIQIEGMTDSEIEEAMDKLRKKARIRDYK